MSSLLDSTRDGRVLHLTLNRPDKRNALNAALCGDLVDALESAAADAAIHAIVLTGAGKSFCAGMDLAEISGHTEDPVLDDLHERLFTFGARLSTPVIAAVHGAALGGGTGLAANCHILVAAPGATFGLTEIRLGLWPFLVFRACAAAMGERRAIELSLTGRVFSAAEARDLALAHEIAEDPAGRAAEIARQVAAFSPLAIRRGLDCVHQSRGIGASESSALARALRREVFNSPGFQAGIRAFLAGRTAKPSNGGTE